MSNTSVNSSDRSPHIRPDVPAFLAALRICDDRQLQQDFLNQCHWTTTIAEALPTLPHSQQWHIVEKAFAVTWELGAILAGRLPLDRQHQAIELLQAAPISGLYRLYLLGKLRSPAVIPTLLTQLADGNYNLSTMAIRGLQGQTSPEMIPALLTALDHDGVGKLLGELGCAAAIVPLTDKIARGSSDAIMVRIEAMRNIGEQAVQRHRQRQPYPPHCRPIEVPIMIRDYDDTSDPDTLELLGMALYEVDRPQAISQLRRTMQSNSYQSTAAARLLFQAGAYNLISFVRWLFRKFRTLIQRPRFPSIQIGIAAATLKALWLSLYSLSDLAERQQVAKAMQAIGGPAWRDRLRQQAGSQDTDVQQAAIELLSGMEDHPSIPRFEAALSSNEPYTRLAAILALARLDTADTLGMAIVALPKLQDLDLAITAITSITTLICNPDAIPTLVQVLETGTPDSYGLVDLLRPTFQRWQSLYAPSGTTSPPSLANQTLADDPAIDELVKSLAGKFLEAFAQMSPRDWLLMSLQSMLLTEANPGLMNKISPSVGSAQVKQFETFKQEVSQTISQHKITLSRLIDIFKASNYPTRQDYQQAANADCQALYQKYLDLQNSYDRDEGLEERVYLNIELRKMASTILARLQATQAIPSLQTMMAQEDRLTPRDVAAYTLVKLGGFTPELLQDRSEAVQEAVLLALAERQDPSTIPAILPLALDPTCAQRFNAISTILDIGGEPAAQTFITMIETVQDEIIRDAAIARLAQTRTPSAGQYLRSYFQNHLEVEQLDWLAEDLGYTGNPALIPLLNSLLENQSTFLKHRILASLVRLGDHAAYPQAIAQIRTPIDSSLDYSTMSDTLKQKIGLAKAVAEASTPHHLNQLLETIAQIDDLELFEILQAAIDSLQQRQGHYQILSIA